jgi:hypothetical protein
VRRRGNKRGIVHAWFRGSAASNASQDVTLFRNWGGAYASGYSEVFSTAGLGTCSFSAAFELVP